MKIATLLNDILSSKTPLAILLILTFLGSVLAFSPAPAFAVVPACGSTITVNTTLTGNIGPCPGNGLIIGASGITLNCARYTISGENSGNGIDLEGMTKVTVKNCKVTGFYSDFYILSSSSDTFAKNRATGSSGDGFYIYSSSSDTFAKNTATSNGGYGFDVSGGSSNTFTQNKATGNSFGGFALSTSHTTLTENTANSNTAMGFYFYYSNSNTLKGNTAQSNTEDGFHFDYSNSTTLKGNTAQSNTQYGYYDGSTGSGSLGTANTYNSNHCKGNVVGGSSPPGLGSPQL